ncbi:MAG TPA: DNA replication/repair protein RecF [Egibacteraceae bacterium]|nr:DNA replication/repair protein RecF [Egibacteraceae bacterium]
MRLETLELADWRSYERARLDLGPGVRVIVGDNAQGKTNLLEAVHYLAIGSSHRVSSDAPLVRHGADAAIVRARALLGATDAAGAQALSVELEVRPQGRNRVRVNGQPQNRPRDAMGLIRSVLFAPEDLSLVRGDPSDRRRFLDELLGQRRPAYLAARQEYERVLKQRNALLKHVRGGFADRADLEVWTDGLVAAGAGLLAARIAAVHALAGPVAEAYADLVSASPEREATGAVEMVYELSTGRRVAAEPGAGMPEPAELAAELAEGLARLASAERERGITLAGPHRDELYLGLKGLPAKGYASHGEHWSLALALRLASREVLLEVGEEPIVLLDDVFAELDERRRARLAERCAGFEQVLVTAAVDHDVPLAGPRSMVRAGTVRS